jgi:capsular exopolysaccharide synthesis family protein
MSIALVGMLGLMLGVALVCLLESLDHKVKAPEHLVHGLTLPLLGVVPKMRRQARLIRGGHFWTAGSADAPEADAFRNVRASLLGAEPAGKPFVTILVASTKPGEGKSTVALNLALTSALAGERTMLIDADLRHSSLAEVFGADNSLGLVDVLQGLLPFQRVALRTEIPNLSFLPCGDASAVPREVLASLELKQLLAALSGQYHRVIIDGSAVLGIADGRMLGQMTDATILVVRSGAYDLRPLRWAKEWLEQSKVKIAGVVFNGLTEGLANWSCDPPRPALGAEGEPASRRSGRGLGSPSAEPDAAAHV